ncbi:hypothetical protein ASPVEDRAFT_128679 [Aspergillus versicolor CBS 583.65]|uniref:NADP-dependent oxidoreductase domain-containing protein n=1 Tax=Aspergillus versicolor CBS 583.65 TaxID=1036611 RepID=A0A1L9PED4_ASPVE|nr:uncharacterized protein ASPVEDRAFT_128679 [Aspergillus versicolor CBS 583.65]OJI99852.1 hypothetical protein ASPVEDRAFT_128679 [Aspergillus versicolor CBS 583.65]
MSFGKRVTLLSGQQIPTLGYGTWQSSPGEVSVGVYEALKAGYRHLVSYENQPEVAQGIKRALADTPGLKREDIFITSKLWNKRVPVILNQKTLDETLRELELDYLDLYLVHWPVAFQKTSDNQLSPLDNDGTQVAIDNSVSLIDTWKAMIKLPQSKVRAIGVSNFTPEHIKAIIDATGVCPVVNQVERHPLLQQNDTLVKYAKEKGIHITAYSAFGNNNVGAPLLLEHPTVKQVAESLSATPAQVLLAWAQSGGHSVIPKSVTPSRIRANFQEIELPDGALTAISAIGSVPRRYNIPVTFVPPWNINLWNEEAEKNAANSVVVGKAA